MDVAALPQMVDRAAAGDAVAWKTLVDHFSGLVWAIARGLGLSRADAADVSQTTWLRLAQHLTRIRHPERLGVWLATTARHESFRTLERARRQVPVDPLLGLTGLADVPEADVRILQEERDCLLWAAFESLPVPCRRLLRMLLADPEPSYAEVSAALGMPVGSIGPTRGRCLNRLRHRVKDQDGEQGPTRAMKGAVA